ncbi:Glycoside hydrolase family 44 [Fibrobacter sp. UWOV1]|uniref:glycoside hydrolase family 44 protein n=1 Tax=Fibrobacter sp. UWOV1 TaxID=1896215 RepID=UPI0009105100|nr:glycoside hydrolase family 44 protein [Fibrobacter sp. UWOV1]SHK76143.1 Glycoside hydrolase family 44 [Fibrobacter sp. UWOV1]
MKSILTAFSTKASLATVLIASAATLSFAAIDITVDAQKGIKKISPYIYGRNIDKISDTDAASDADEEAFIAQMLDAGIHMMRANNGNNSTRYNWSHKMTVHPDWFNNVYAHDWDITAKKVLDKMPGVDAMYAFQLTGYAASSTEYNFPDWNWKQEHGSYPSRAFDLAGGGEVSDDGETLIKAGDASLYNMEWPADSTVAIIPHWKDELQYDMSRFKYWSMDNEMEIWRGTHNDLDLPVTGDFLVERYIDVAKKARAQWKDIKLTGPVVANEWQWCHINAYNDESRPKIDGQEYCWLEFFTKKIAEAEKASGVRLLDVFDIHWYPTEKDYESRVNWHRVLFDTTYYYKGGNGVRCATGKCDWSDKEKGYKSYIFVRINNWLEKYFGKGHGISLGITETSLIDEDDPMVTALTYASFLGTMQDNGVEIFTPWTWGDGMYETVHLFSRYGHPNRVQSTSSNDSLVSAYSSISNKGDSLTVIFVNRAEKDAQDVNLSLANFASDGKVKTLTLQNLQGETFVSHSSNALKENAVEANAQGGTTTATSYSINSFRMTLPAKSITAVLLTSNSPTVVDAIKPKATIRPAPQYGNTSRFDTKGRNVTHTRTSPGFYILR